MFTLRKDNVIETMTMLNNGREFPVIGFGTYQITGRSTIHSVLDTALEAGYRGIDTAAVYGNETDIGIALKTLLPKYKLKRSDVHITTKLSPSNLSSAASVKEAVQNSLSKLGIDYIDLYLIHWPGSSGLQPSDPRNKERRRIAWETLTALHDNGNGVLKSIGVSNYTVNHLEELMTFAKVPPAVNQVEFHPRWPQTSDFATTCKEYKILPQSYSTLGGTGNRELLKDPVILEISKRNNISPAQTLLRWALQKGYAIIPKSVTRERIEANADLNVNLSEEDMKAINDIPSSGKRQALSKYSWNPDAVF